MASIFSHKGTTRDPKLSPAAEASGEGLSVGAMTQMPKASLWENSQRDDYFDVIKWLNP